MWFILSCLLDYSHIVDAVMLNYAYIYLQLIDNLFTVCNRVLSLLSYCVDFPAQCVDVNSPADLIQCSDYRTMRL